jgi:hypothetical protein
MHVSSGFYDHSKCFMIALATFIVRLIPHFALLSSKAGELLRFLNQVAIYQPFRRATPAWGPTQRPVVVGAGEGGDVYISKLTRKQKKNNKK